MPEDVNTAFTRTLLRDVIADVRKYAQQTQKPIRFRDAWVWKCGRDHWEFHFGEFYWHGSADNAYDARANGWSAWLRKQGAEGYTE